MPTQVVEETVQTIRICQEIEIAAPIDIAFEAILAEAGPESTMRDGTPMPFVLEAWPGGRWFRDLGNHTGHLWGHVQVIKPPKLLELSGPMFMSYPAINFVQYRLTAEGLGTRLQLTHRALGLIPAEHREGVQEGWKHGIQRIREIAAKLAASRGVNR
jgi:uncharacterized protein YndB with AHSA1/START domain